MPPRFSWATSSRQGLAGSCSSTMSTSSRPASESAYGQRSWTDATRRAFWVAERTEALQPSEDLGSRHSRDEGLRGLREPRDRMARRPRPKELQGPLSALSESAAREWRSTSPPARPIPDHSRQHSTPGVDSLEWAERLNEAISEESRVALKDLAEASPRYARWVRSRLAQDHDTPRQYLITLRALEILIERDRRKAQLPFEYEELPAEDLESRDDSAVRNAAELFLARGALIPILLWPRVRGQPCLPQHRAVPAPRR